MPTETEYVVFVF